MIRKLLHKLGALPTLIIGIGFIILGLLGLQRIVNSIWLFDVDRLDLVRGVAQDQVEAHQLLDAAYTDVIIAFLAAVTIIIIGFCLPLAYYLNKRFAPRNLRFFIIFRQAMWVGLWGGFCVWLQMNRALGLAVAILVAAVFILFEALLQVRTRATALPIKPPQTSG